MIPLPIDNSPWNPALFYDKAYEVRLLWHEDLRSAFTLHPSVVNMLQHRPANYLQLHLEWPSVSEKDPTRLAYTVNETHGIADRRTVTSIGKYLARHWPHIPDHVRRDAQALFTPDKMYFVYTTPDMIIGVENGPRSCMASCHGSIPFRRIHYAKMVEWIDAKRPETGQPPWHLHPYACYEPQYGWHMALRNGPSGSIDGRALCLEVRGKKSFVRTYKRAAEEGGHSETDHALNAWLEAQGYQYADAWPEGAKLAFKLDGALGRISRAPYLDGDLQRVSLLDDKVFETDYEGQYSCDRTDGTVAGDDNDNDDDDDDDTSCACNECNAFCHIDDIVYIGRLEDEAVCEGCFEELFVQVEATRHGVDTRYYILSSNASKLGESDNLIDPDYPPSYVVQLEGGEYAYTKDCVRNDNCE